MIVRWLANKLERAVSNVWRLLFSMTTPGFGIGKNLDLNVAPVDSGGYQVTASFELLRETHPIVAEEIEKARQRLSQGGAMQALIDAANRSNASIGAHLVSGAAQENHYFVAIVPRGRTPRG